jgi:hypothetical protein
MVPWEFVRLRAPETFQDKKDNGLKALTELRL